MLTNDNITLHELPVYWSLKQDEPELYKTLIEHIPSVAIADHLNPFPVQKNAVITPLTETMVVRPHRHWRAFYFKLQQYHTNYEGYLALKGTEALSENIPELLNRIKSVHSIYTWSTRKSGLGLPINDHALLPMYDRFLFLENKIPLLYSLSEAVEAVSSSLELQKAYLNTHSMPAKIPIPIAIYHIPPEKLEPIDSLFKEFYDVKRYRNIHHKMKEGVAIQTYWYPTIPERVAYLNYPAASCLTTFKTRMHTLSAIMDVPSCIDQWILLFCRFLNLGYLLADPTSYQEGYCLDPGNLVLDGGFVDMSGIRHIDTFHYPGESQFIFKNTIDMLVNGILSLLIGSGSMSFGLKSVFPDFTQNIYQAIKNNIDIDTKAQRFIHPTVKQWVSPKPNAQDIIEKLSHFLEL